jgi:hypothetical protein
MIVNRFYLYSTHSMRFLQPINPLQVKWAGLSLRSGRPIDTMQVVVRGLLGPDLLVPHWLVGRGCCALPLFAVQHVLGLASHVHRLLAIEQRVSAPVRVRFPDDRPVVAPRGPVDHENCAALHVRGHRVARPDHENEHEHEQASQRQSGDEHGVHETRTERPSGHVGRRGVRQARSDEQEGCGQAVAIERTNLTHRLTVIRVRYEIGLEKGHWCTSGEMDETGQSGIEPNLYIIPKICLFVNIRTPWR